MSNVIAFLESLGKDVAFSAPAPEAYADAVQALDLDDAARQALLARDAAGLNDLLGGRMKMMCLLFPADSDKNHQDGEEPEGEGEQPVEDEPKSSIHH
jgi:hypothetical protein